MTPETPPEEAIAEAERLTRLARAATDADERAAYEGTRERVLGEHGYTARVREDEAGATLVCYPAEWVEDGTVRTQLIDDTARAVEVTLEGAGDPAAWAAVDDYNREIVSAVRDRAGEIHGANAAALADFMGNHRARRIDTATGADLEEFLGEYYRRNAWPSDAQKKAVVESIRLVFDEAGADVPDFDRSVRPR